VLRRVVAMGFALGLAHDPCTGVDSPGGGVNSPCTRTTDCENGLSCDAGVCTPPSKDASPDSPEDREGPAEAAHGG
jgi:hypothetical protein